jgi:hypothetical protein
MLKNSSTLAVSVAINISMKLCFVSVNSPREPYLLDEPRRIERDDCERWAENVKGRSHGLLKHFLGEEALKFDAEVRIVEATSKLRSRSSITDGAP